MKLTHCDISKEIDFAVNKKQLLVVENSKEFFNVVNDFLKQSNGESGSFVLSYQNKILDISKETLIMHNFFEIDFNTRKIESAINTEVLSLINSNDYFELIGEINEKFVVLNDKIKEKLDFNVSYDEDLDAEKLLKLAKFKIVQENDLLNQILSFVELNLKLKHFNLLILVNVSQILNFIDLEKVLKQIEYLDVNLLMIESYKKYEFNNFGITIIDEDLCVI